MTGLRRPRRHPLRTWMPRIALAAPLAAAASAQAESPAAHMVGEFAGGRAEAMGRAHRGDGRNNETLNYNPAGMALLPRYSIDVQYGYRGTGHLNDLAISVVDSKSSRVAAGLRAARAWGNPSGIDLGVYQLAAGTAVALTQRVSLGATVKNHRGSWRPDLDAESQDLSLWTGTVGAMARVAQVVTIGVVGENLIRVKSVNQVMLRPTAAAGASLNLGRFNVAGDLRVDLRDGVSRAPDFSVGGEALVATGLALRAGYFTEQTLPNAPRRQSFTGGLGLMSTTASFNISLLRSLGDQPIWGLYTGLQMAV